jgi:hypothetical protein
MNLYALFLLLGLPLFEKKTFGGRELNKPSCEDLIIVLV